MPILFVLLAAVTILVVCMPYILLYWWLKPITVMGYLAVFGSASIILLLIVIIVGWIQNSRANRL